MKDLDGASLKEVELRNGKRNCILVKSFKPLD